MEDMHNPRASSRIENEGAVENSTNIQQFWNNYTSLSTMNSYFAGTTPEKGEVLWLTAETHVTKRLGYTKFRYILSNYVVKNMRDSVEIVYTLHNQKDPVTECVNKYAPKLLGDNPAKVLIEEMILKEDIKEYVVRKRNILSNLNMISSLVWGKFSDSL